LGDSNYFFGVDSLTGQTTAVAALNDITTIAANLTDRANLFYGDSNGFQVAYVDFNPSGTVNDVFIPGIRLAGSDNTRPSGSLNLQTLDGAATLAGFSGIQLTATGNVYAPGGQTTFISLTEGNQYDLLGTFGGGLAPGHLEVAENITIVVQDPTTAAGGGRNAVHHAGRNPCVCRHERQPVRIYRNHG
jgi:hypothetical protein